MTIYSLSYEYYNGRMYDEKAYGGYIINYYVDFNKALEEFNSFILTEEFLYNSCYLMGYSLDDFVEEEHRIDKNSSSCKAFKSFRTHYDAYVNIWIDEIEVID